MMSPMEERATLSPGTTYDPGLTQTYTGKITRIVDREGNFNVRRAGRNWRDFNPYTYLISVSWWNFSLIVIVTFILVNLLFAWAYSLIGADQIKVPDARTSLGQFFNLFFFSAHTLTTVGFGNMYPVGVMGNVVAAIEALLGLMAFAIATGLLFGRFSQPSARFGFSQHMAIAPFRDETSLQFRVVNRRSNNLIEVEAKVMLMTVELVKGKLQRKFTPLDLERTQILFMPLTWTVVHPIDKQSPLYGKNAADLESLQAEVVVMMRGYDETFGQVVYARYSYRYDEILWGVKFSAAFEIDPEGDLVLAVDKVGLTEPVPMPEIR